MKAWRQSIWVAMVGVILAVARGAADDGLELGVMTFNLRYITSVDKGQRTWEARRDLVASVMKEQGADFICVQEAFRTMLDDVHERLPGYGEAGVGREDGKQKGEYSAILYRETAWEMKDSGTFWLSDTPTVAGSATWGNRVTRICTWGKFRHRSTARELFVFNAHFDHESQPSRERAAALVLQRIRACGDETPVVFTGDLNAQPDNPAIGAIRQGPPVLRDAWLELNPNVPPAQWGTAHHFAGALDGPHIDYIFLSPGIVAKDAEILRVEKDGLWPSDHFPVRAKLRIEPVVTKPAPSPPGG